MPDVADLPRPSSPVVVVGRYAGTVEVLVALLVDRGLPVHATGALDREGPDGVTALLADLPPGAVVVLTVAPGDPTLTLVARMAPGARLVAVTWHPADELPTLPPATAVVAAGRIRATLAATVAAQAHE